MTFDVWSFIWCFGFLSIGGHGCFFQFLNMLCGVCAALASSYILNCPSFAEEIDHTHLMHTCKYVREVTENDTPKANPIFHSFFSISFFLFHFFFFCQLSGQKLLVDPCFARIFSICKYVNISL